VSVEVVATSSDAVGFLLPSLIAQLLRKSIQLTQNFFLEYVVFLLGEFTNPLRSVAAQHCRLRELAAACVVWVRCDIALCGWGSLVASATAASQLFWLWLCAPAAYLVLRDSPSEKPTWREKAKLVMRCQFSEESASCPGFLPFCMQCCTGVKGGDGIKPEDERAGPQQIQSVLVVIPLILHVELGCAGSFQCDQALKL